MWVAMLEHRGVTDCRLGCARTACARFGCGGGACGAESGADGRLIAEVGEVAFVFGDQSGPGAWYHLRFVAESVDVASCGGLAERFLHDGVTTAQER